MRESQVRFIRQQGVSNPDAGSHLYSALMLQPRIVGGLTALGILLQTPWLFFGLSAALWVSALVPTLNPFDAIYNHTVARPRGLPPLGVAPAPRRVSAGLAAALALAIGVALLVGARNTSWVLEGLLGGAVIMVFLGFCPGAYVYRFFKREVTTAARDTATQRVAGRDDSSDPSASYSHGCSA